MTLEPERDAGGTLGGQENGAAWENRTPDLFSNLAGPGLATERTLADVITAAALSEPLSPAHARVSDSDLGEPALLRRRDGASVYTTHGSALFTSSEILSAEKRVLDAARVIGHTYDYV
ncbi:MAG: hypothetical protein WCB92_02140 [Mycobacterium sp.]